MLRPVQRRSAADTTGAMKSVFASAATEFRALVDTCIIVLLATGIILTLNRLTPGVVGVPYAIALGVKITLSAWMFVLARGRRRRTPLMEAYAERTDAPERRLGRVIHAVSGYNSLVILGIVVFLVSDLLKVLFELALAG